MVSVSTKALCVARLGRAHVLRLVAVLGFGLMAAACSKCDVPNLLPNGTGQAPHVCHDTLAP